MNIARFKDFAVSSVAAAAILMSVSCERVPLLAPSGSTITLTASTTAVSVNGTAQLIAQVIEQSGTPPHSGTHVIFTTTLGSVKPPEGDTDINGRVLAIFDAGTANGTATITVTSGGAGAGSSQSGGTGTTGTSTPSNAVKIAVGTAAVGRVTVAANPTLVPATGGNSTISAAVTDINGNGLAYAAVSFSTTNGAVDPSQATTDSNGVATTTLRTTATAAVTANVGATGGTGTGGGGGGGTTTPPASGQASGTVTVNVAASPTLVIAPPTTPPSAGLPAIFTFTVGSSGGGTSGGVSSAIRDLSVNWGDGSPTQDLGVVTSTSTQSHVYKNAASYLISAVLIDTIGNTVTQSTQVTVIPVQRPGIQITQSPNPGHSGVPTTLLIQVTPATGIGVQDLLVDYGDGQTADLGGTSSAQLQHIYNVAAGSSTFTVRVTVLDTSGQTTIGLAVISVTNP